jgi:potassium-dependent mechanosensitive channel
MIRALAALILAAGLCLAAVAAAEDAPVAVDFAGFGAVAAAAEARLVDGTTSDADLEAERATLAGWRSQFLAAESANRTTIQRLQAQIDALGPVPAEGASEPSEIAERRSELARQMGEAQVPRLAALEAFNRADGLIAEIDTTLRERQTATFLQRAPAPLLPSSLAAAGREAWAVARMLGDEVAQPFGDPGDRAGLSDAGLVFAALAAFGLLLVVKGRAWVHRLAAAADRRRARDTVVFLVSLGQVFVPVLGAVLVVGAIGATGVMGAAGAVLLGGIASLLVSTFGALWLGGRLFPADDARPAALAVPVALRPRLRRLSVALGVVLGIGAILGALGEMEAVSEAARGVFLLPYLLALSAVFWPLARALGTTGKETDGEDEAPDFVARLVSLLVGALRAVAVVGPLLALAGYINAAEGLMRPAGLSLGLLALLLALQVPIRDLYALLTRTAPEEAGRALVPVLINFGLAAASMPVFALIWGMRRTEIAEVWSRVQEGVSLGGTRITPGAILTVILVFAAVLLVTRLVQGALKTTVLPRTRLDPGARNAVAAGVGYVGVAVAGLAGINAAGIDLTTLAFVVSALSIGIGFGLRNVIENFVAGLILLIERPIGEGDWIEVGGNMGIVKQISVRSTVIETFDRQQLIVPNGDFITGTVTNWTRGSQVGRAIVTVGAAYGTDTRRVQQILMEIAKAQEGVMQFPEPAVDFMGFGADSLDFRVRALLYDVTTMMAVKTEMHHRIAERFAEEGIEIPFAQRDIWLRNPEALVQAREAPTGPPADIIIRAPETPKPHKGPGKPLRREPGGIEAAADQDGEQT